MSTLTTRDALVRDSKQAVISPEAATIPAKRASFSLPRLLTWYRTAVLSPSTNDEQAEWQKNSF